MKEQTKIRMEMITARFAKRLTEAGNAGELVAARKAEFLRGFERVRADVLRPAMEGIGAELVRAGHAFRVDLGDTPEHERPLEATLWGQPPCGRALVRLADGTRIGWRRGRGWRVDSPHGERDVTFRAV